MADKTVGRLRTELNLYLSPAWSDHKKLKKMLASVSPQSRYTLLLSMRADGRTATLRAAALKDPRHHAIVLRCMLDGLTTQQKYSLLQQQNEPYGNNVLHLLVTKNSPEVTDTIVYLLDGLNIEQRQSLVYMRNTADETVIDRAQRSDTTSAIPNLLIESVRGASAIEAPPSYEATMLGSSMNLTFTQLHSRDNSPLNETVPFIQAMTSSDQRLTEHEVKYNQLQELYTRMEKEKDEQIQDLTAKLRAAEEKIEKMNLREIDVEN